MLNKLEKDRNVFNPSIIYVNTGDTVKWISVDKGHNIAFTKKGHSGDNNPSAGQYQPVNTQSLNPARLKHRCPLAGATAYFLGRRVSCGGRTGGRPATRGWRAWANTQTNWRCSDRYHRSVFNDLCLQRDGRHYVAGNSTL